MYLAKSNGESIEDHTYEVLKRAEALFSYTELNINRFLLEDACRYHDLGKVTDKFQEKLKTHVRMVEGEVPHGLVSVGFLMDLKDKYSENEFKALCYAVGFHHERDFFKYSTEDIKREWLNLSERLFDFDRINFKGSCAKRVSRKWFNPHRYLTQKDACYLNYCLLKGLLNKCDYAASAGVEVEKPRGVINRYLNGLGYKWNDLQEYMKNQGQKKQNTVVVAQTGLGKTEAALLWADNEKTFFTLPLRSALNAMYARLNDEEIGLLHGSFVSEIIEEEDWFAKETLTRQLSLPLTFTTLDQLFDIVYRYPGHEMKLAVLSYSRVIIDEIQMYSADLLAYLLYGLKQIQSVGGCFTMITATLAPFIVDLMRKGLTFNSEIEYFSDDDCLRRHYVQVRNEELSVETIEGICLRHVGQKILIICNTVKAALEIYQALKIDFDKVYCLHSRFILKDRKQKEAEIMNHSNDPDWTGIWVTTQVVEASLDIDFDLLITELSDLNGLFQRMGRCHRKRNYEGKSYNVIVFDGGEGKTNGVGHVIDEQIYALSKEALSGVDGRLSEERKWELINCFFTTERLYQSAYYQELLNTLQYLDDIDANDYTRSEVKRRFRSIDSRSVMPVSVYECHKNEIEQYLKDYTMSGFYSVSDDEREQMRCRKVKAQAALESFMVNIMNYDFDSGLVVKELPIGKYQCILVYDCEYDSEIGFMKKDAVRGSNIF